MRRTDRCIQLLAIDVGGTKTRAALADGRRGEASILWQVEAVVGDKARLRRFIREVFLRSGAAPDRCAVDFAGPLRGRTEARMTNWGGNPVIRLRDLEAWGLPAGRTLMLNDLEAAAWGIMALEEGALPARMKTVLYRPKGPLPAPGGNRVVLAPGTGLGTASIVAGRSLPSEISHADASPLDVRHAALIARFRRSHRRPPSWENFASGPGLVETYRGLCAMDGVSPSVLAGRIHDEDTAGDVARAAGSDPHAGEALDLYYGCVGRVAQILALVLQPTAGVYICGASTAGNAAFLRRSRFLREFHANAAQGLLLRRFPVFMVTADLNLPGGLRACLHPALPAS